MVQKTEETEDLRVQRTRRLIQEAFIALTVEKGFAAVTVRDITERAIINRSTFYRHYLDKYDLLDQFMTNVYQLTSGIEEPEAEGMEALPGPVKLLRHIQQHAVRVHQTNMASLPHKRHRRPLHNRHAHPVRQQTHHRRALHPRQPLQLRPSLRQRNIEDIPLHISAKDAQQLRPRQMAVALNLN